MIQKEAGPNRKDNTSLAVEVLEELISLGVSEFCLCAGSRNAPLIYPLVNAPHVKVYHWPEERSAAFFALGRIKATGRPVAVVTTSGTAAAELLPATMEAYYSGLPLILITADRPPRFRKSGSPQSVEQVGLYGCYAPDMHDLTADSVCSLDCWTKQSPLHLNICFEEPSDKECRVIRIQESVKNQPVAIEEVPFSPDGRYLAFLKKCRFPFVVIGALPLEQREWAVSFLLHLNAPLYAEGVSHLREESRLQHLQMRSIENLWHLAERNNYPIDGVLRLGSVPTARFWRDLELKRESIHVCSVSETPFPGLSSADVIHTSLSSFLQWAMTIKSPWEYVFNQWREADGNEYTFLFDLFEKEPFAEKSLLHTLSSKIPLNSKVFLGNSLPIREWDQAAVFQQRGYHVGCSRGANGIDGQISTFLGFCSAKQDNWSILGDLTALYDMVAPWITSQLKGISANIVVVNNGGGAIFSQMYENPVFQNSHQLTFEPFARFWGWRYERWESIPACIQGSQGGRLIELIPDVKSTARFYDSYRGGYK